MNLQNILHEIEQVDGDYVERIEHVTRRHMFSLIAKRATAAAAPVVLGAALNKAYADQATVVDVLNFALLLEYLEAEFYNVGMDTPGLLTGTARTVYMQIQKHENAHVKLLQTALGSAAISKPGFDFSYKGAFPDVLTNYYTYIAVSQALEDTGVRAYKGQAPRLINDKSVLQTALQIHSVEAKHAARVRVLNGKKGWITLNQGFPPAVYAGEEATMHLEVSSIIGGVPIENSTEAWDEPLSKADVLAIATPFLR